MGNQSEYALRISKEEWCSAVLLDMTAVSLRDLEHCEVGIQRTPQDFKGIYWSIESSLEVLGRFGSTT